MPYAGTRKRRMRFLRDTDQASLTAIREAAYTALGEADDPEETTEEVAQRVNDALAEAQSSGS